MFSENEYNININFRDLKVGRGLDFKTILTHELGHFVDNVVIGCPREVSQGYTLTLASKSTTLPVLKWEASAWRNALKIYPKLDKETLKFCFKRYVSRFNPEKR